MKYSVSEVFVAKEITREHFGCPVLHFDMLCMQRNMLGELLGYVSLLHKEQVSAKLSSNNDKRTQGNVS